jgi:aspartate carbamoyltransferase catalytic subunit
MAYLYFQAPVKFTRRTPLDFTRRTRHDFSRHLLSTRAMTREDVDEYCKAAAAFEARRTIDRASSGRTIALLFFQPSTRTRIGFEVATVALGSHAIGMEDMSDMSDIGELAGSDYISPSTTPDSHKITAEKVERTRSKALLFHPLPRHDEIDPGCDDLPNAMYFDQVRLSKFMRMAVLDRILASP